MSELEVTKIINDILFSSGGSIIVNKNLASNIGLDAAILYSELCSKYKYFSQKNELDKNGYFFNTVENMKNDTFLSDYRQREAIKKLKKLDLIYYQKKGLPARRYFKVNLNYEPIARLTKDPSNQNLKNCASKFKDMDLKKLEGNNTNPNNPNIINTNILNGLVVKSNQTCSFNKLKDSINYYLEKYEEYMECSHPILKKEKWLEVIEKMQDFGHENSLDIPDDFNSIIDRYFNTEFPTHPCDRNILHFTSGDIMLNRLYEEERYGQENETEINGCSPLSTILKNTIS